LFSLDEFNNLTERFLAVIVGEASPKVIYQFSDLKTYAMIVRQAPT